MKSLRWPLLLPMLALFAGCFQYVPSAEMALPQGTEVRVRLDTLQAFELSAITVNNVEQVDGEMVRPDAGDLVLSATWLQAVTGAGFDGGGWTVRIPETNVTTFEVKRFSWWRSAVIVGGIIAGTVLGFDALGLGPGGGTGGGGGANQL